MLWVLASPRRSVGQPLDQLVSDTCAMQLPFPGKGMALANLGLATYAKGLSLDLTMTLQCKVL